MSGPIIGGIIAATVGGIIAIKAILTNRAVARLRATDQYLQEFPTERFAPANYAPTDRMRIGKREPKFCFS
jgi:hypothetical protein